MYQRILVPIDGSPHSQRALEEAIALGELTRARIRLIHVIDEFSVAMADAGGGFGSVGGYAGTLHQALRDTGTEMLNQAEAHVRAAGLEVDSVLSDSFQGRICELVVAEAKNWKAELIVLGSHGRRGVGRVLMGSDAENILRLAPVPVLLLRVTEAAGKS